MKGILLSACAVAVLATAATSTAAPSIRYKLKPGASLTSSLRQLNRIVNRAAGFSHVDCWMYDGNAKLGWRHGACVGDYTYGGTVYRFKMTSTPVSCSRERQLLVVPGVQRLSRVGPWKHATFDCGRG